MTEVKYTYKTKGDDSEVTMICDESQERFKERIIFGQEGVAKRYEDEIGLEEPFNPDLIEFKTIE